VGAGGARGGLPGDADVSPRTITACRTVNPSSSGAAFWIDATGEQWETVATRRREDRRRLLLSGAESPRLPARWAVTGGTAAARNYTRVVAAISALMRSGAIGGRSSNAVIDAMRSPLVEVSGQGHDWMKIGHPRPVLPQPAHGLP